MKKLLTIILSSTFVIIGSISVFAATDPPEGFEMDESEHAILAQEFSELDAIEYNTDKILNDDDSVGVEALIPVDDFPIEDLGRAGHNSPATALQNANFNTRNRISFTPQGTWYRWTPAKSVQAGLHTIIFQRNQNNSNFDLLLTNADLSIIYLIPANQNVHLSFNELARLFELNPNSINSMDLFLTVQASSGNTGDYQLFYGNTHRNAFSQWIDTNLTFNIGTIDVPPPLIWYTPAQITNSILNNSSVPWNAAITQMYLSTDGTGHGLDMRYVVSQSGINTGVQFNLQAVPGIPSGVHPVRQQYRLQASVIKSTNLVWRPRMQFGYTWPVTLTDIQHVPVRDIR